MGCPVKELIFARKPRWLDALLAILIVLFGIACFRMRMPFTDIFSNTTLVDYSYIGRTSDDVYYVVDRGHMRLMAFNSDSQELFEIVNPSDNEESALYIDDVFIDEDTVYLTASEWDGMLLSRELILAYDKQGNYQKTIHELTYDDGSKTTNKHRIYGFHREGEQLVWAECWDNVIRVCRRNLDEDGGVNIWTPPYANSFNAVADIIFDEGFLVVCNKNGTIERYSRKSEPQLLYSTAWEGEEEHVPFRLAVSEGSIYFTDIKAGSVEKINSADQRSETVREGTDSQTVTFSEDGSEMLLAESQGLVVVGASEEACYDILTLKQAFIRQHIVFFACLVGLGLALLLGLIRLYCVLKGRSFERATTVPLAVVTVALIVCTIVSYLLINSFRDLYMDKIREQLQMTAMQVRGRITEEDLDGVKLAEDFDSDSYDNLIAIMDDAMPLDVDFFHTTYCNILRLADDGETGYGLAYRDQSIGTYFPLDEIETDEVIEVYETRAPVWDDAVLDVSGSYVSVKIPIMGSTSRVCGVVAVGADTSVVAALIKEMQKEVLLSIVVVLLIFWIIATEAVSLAAQSAALRHADSEQQVMPAYLVRVLVFAVFAAFNLVSSFLPVYVLRQSDAIQGPLHDLAGTIPLTINIFAMGVMSLFCAGAMRRFGIRRVFLGSMACSLVGNVMLFLAPAYPFIVAGLLLDGVGVGMITNAIYVALTYLPDEASRQGAFSTYNGASMSGINFGMIMGSVLAVSLGQRKVFFVVVITWAALMLLGAFLARSLEQLMSPSTEEADASRGSISIGTFIGSRPIWSFILLVQNPYIVFNSFAYYFVPLVCDTMGYRETIASVLMMLYSQTAVMLSDSLTEQMEKSFGGRSVYVALGLNVVAVALYICTQTVLGLIGALLLLGVSAAFAKPCQQSLYLRQDVSKQLGEDQAMGIYNFSENIGESLGPIVFGSLMAGPIGYVWAFLGTVLGAGAAHFTLNRKEMGRGE